MNMINEALLTVTISIPKCSALIPCKTTRHNIISLLQQNRELRKIKSCWKIVSIKCSSLLGDGITILLNYFLGLTTHSHIGYVQTKSHICYTWDELGVNKGLDNSIQSINLLDCNSKSQVVCASFEEKIVRNVRTKSHNS